MARKAEIWEPEEAMKREVEDLLGCGISDGQFREALEHARRKQAYIYKRERRPVVLQRWYLAKLTEECVRSLAFSKFTMDLCRMRRETEKEHSASCQSAPTDKFIVTVSAGESKQNLSK